MGEPAARPEARPGERLWLLADGRVMTVRPSGDGLFVLLNEQGKTVSEQGDAGLRDLVRYMGTSIVEEA